MYSCYVHGWSSHHSMCPACQVITTSTTTDTEINLAFENVSLEDKYKSAIKMLEEMAAALAIYEHDHSRIVDTKTAAATLDNYRKWKAGMK